MLFSRAGRFWLLPAVLVLGGWVPGLAQTNQLDQPAFEGPYQNGVAAGWRKFPIRALVRGQFAEASPGHSGAKAQLLEVTELMGAWLQCSAPIRGGIIAGHDYEARVWLKGDRLLENTALLVHDGTDWFPATHAETSRNLDQPWQEVVLRFRARKTDPQAWLGIKLAQEGKLWADDASFRELTPEERPPEKPGNRVRNGSFEVGLDNWVSYWCDTKIVADAQAPDGGKVLELPGGAPGRELASAAIFAPWGRPCTLALSLRADEAVKVKVLLRHGTEAFGEQEVAVGRQWQRFTLTAAVPPLPDGFFHIALQPGPARIFVDAVQLTSGERAPAFTPAAPVEAGLVIDQAIGTTGEAVTATLRLYNATPETQALDLTLRVIDAGRQECLTQALPVKAAPGLTELPLNLAPHARTGSFRAEITARTNPAVPLAERAFARLPALPADPASRAPLGAQIDYGGLSFMPRAGSTWTKTWRLSWDSMESATSEWHFPLDAEVAQWRAAGLAVMAVLSDPPRARQDRPANALNWGWYPPRDFGAETEYARRAAAHYAGQVAVWELQNEPDQALHPPPGQTGAAGYAREALALAEGVRAAQPTARIVLGGGVTMGTDPERWLADVLAAQPHLRELCAAFSYHNYSADPAVTRRNVTRLRAKMRELGWERPIWDTEWNPTDSVASAYRTAPRHLSTHWVTAARAAALLVQGFVARMGEGVDQSFLYQAYGPGSMASSAFDLFHEADGSPRAAMVAQAVLAGQLAGTKPLGPLDVPGGWAYRFQRPDGSQLVVVWQRDTEPGPISLALPGTWRITDLMGNDLGPLTKDLPIDTNPVYLNGILRH